MANHLTPEELSKETGIKRDDVVRLCHEQAVPIYLLRRFDVGVDLGTPGDAVRVSLRQLGTVGMIVGADIVARDKPFVVADEEALPFRDASIDLVVSGLALHFANDLPGVLAQIRRALKPDGLFLAALLGGETLIELRQAFAEAESEIESGAASSDCRAPRATHTTPKHSLRPPSGVQQSTRRERHCLRRRVCGYLQGARICGAPGIPRRAAADVGTTEPVGDLQGPLGLYHNAITLLSDTFPVLSPNGARKIEAWHAAQVLLMSLTGRDFAKAVRSLARFHPVVVRLGSSATGGITSTCGLSTSRATSTSIKP